MGRQLGADRRPAGAGRTERVAGHARACGERRTRQQPGPGPAGEGADALVCLGDLVLFLDYADHSRGIFPDLFGVENADRIVELRTARRFEEARAFGRGLCGRASTADAAIETAVRKQYAELFAAFPTPTYATYGNVDIPCCGPSTRGPAPPSSTAQRAEIGGRVFGFVGGGLQDPDAHPVRDQRRGVRGQDRGRSARSTCCARTSRPRCRSSCYDTVARRFERGSGALLDAIRAHPPAVRALRPRPPAAGAADADRRARSA